MLSRLLSKCVGQLFLPLALAAPVMLAGCTVHAGVYDPYYRDRHAWAGETVYYQQWETDTHRDHRDFNRRNDADKREYWDWRHKQEHGHDDDRR